MLRKRLTLNPKHYLGCHSHQIMVRLLQHSTHQARKRLILLLNMAAIRLRADIAINAQYRILPNRPIHDPCPSHLFQLLFAAPSVFNRQTCHDPPFPPSTQSPSVHPPFSTHNLHLATNITSQTAPSSSCTPPCPPKSRLSSLKHPPQQSHAPTHAPSNR